MVSVRALSTGDLQDLVDLINSAYRGDTARRGWTHEADLLGGQRTDLAMMTEAAADPDNSILVAEARTQLCGCVQIARRDGGLAHLSLLTVSPDLQAGGVGRTLLEAGEAYAAAELGARRMELTVIKGRDELVAWYERRGYRLSGEERAFPAQDVRFGLPRRDLSFVVLEKPLAEARLLETSEGQAAPAP